LLTLFICGHKTDTDGLLKHMYIFVPLVRLITMKLYQCVLVFLHYKHAHEIPSKMLV
jgi:hypothetical protein